MISLTVLQAICPKTDVERLARFVDPLNAAMSEFEINTPLREASFVAQTAHESGGFRWLREMWGPTEEQKAYEPPGHKADDLGNVLVGDGFLYRGRGLIQITGRANYAAVGAALGINCLTHPELLEQPEHACRSAAWWWKARGCNEIADTGDFGRLTRRINGGLNGLVDRLAYLHRAKDALAAFGTVA